MAQRRQPKFISGANDGAWRCEVLEQ